ncbi:tol-pal system protein YbgF [Rhodoplanes sp. Z2-YC6860]|uniref:tol-pal system protein YbgF n=1 Tax=Rhodoplanes sp. Z2-YC6860 TaxID=674703 RepID=UPI00082C42A0|nr:tol-pal system protein YbgF [Rhodoplanes sp. Z2-YC6860]
MMTVNRGLTMAALAAALCISTAAAAQDNGSPPWGFDRLFQRPQANVPQGQQSQGQQGQWRGQQAGGQEEALPDQVLRAERAEQQLRQMTGQVEQLQYRNQQLEAQIRAMGGTPGGTAGAQPGQPPQQQPAQGAQMGQPLPPMQQPRTVQGAPMAAPSAPPAAAAPGRRSDVFDPSQNPNAPGAPHALGSLSSNGAAEPPVVIEADSPVGAPGGRGAGAPLDLSTMTGRGGEPGYTRQGAEPGYEQQGSLPAPPSRNVNATGAVASVAPPTEQPKDYYDLGYGYVLRKDYALAEQTFDSFLKKYPNDRRAPEAQFWLGESLFQRQRYDAAAQAFLDLSTKYGTHPKAPEALLRLGQSLAALKQKEMSCATFAEIGRKYPKAPASVKQGVEREQKRVQC